MAPDLEAQLKAGEKLAETDIDAAVSQMKGLVLDSSCNDADAVKVKEQTIQKMCDLLVKNKDATGLSQLLSQFRDFFNVIPKAKTAKIVRSIIDSVAKIPGSTQLQVRAHDTHVLCMDVRRRPLLNSLGCASAGEHLQGADGMGENRKADVPAAAHRAQACQSLPGYQELSRFARNHWDVS
eukprot:364397-Chlamydomonas_euryale.AAC.5